MELPQGIIKKVLRQFFAILCFQNEKDSFTVSLKPFTELDQINSTKLLRMGESRVGSLPSGGVTASGK